MGPRIGPKIVKNRFRKALSFLSFFGPRFLSFSDAFSTPKWSPKSTFLVSGIGFNGFWPKPQSLMTVQHFFTFFEGPGLRKSIENRVRIDGETKLVLACVSDPVSGRFSEGFGVPKRSGKRSGTGLFGTSEKNGFAGAWKSDAPRRELSGVNGPQGVLAIFLVLHMIRSA